MSEKKNWGSTVLGWFVVREGEEAGASPGEPPALSAEEIAAATPEPPPVAFVKEPPKAVGGEVDFDGVLDAAGVDASERDLFAKAQALLGSLPPGTDPAVRRQIVEASLKAFGVPVDKIIEAGVESIQALEGYLRKTAGDTAPNTGLFHRAKASKLRNAPREISWIGCSAIDISALKSHLRISCWMRAS